MHVPGALAGAAAVLGLAVATPTAHAEDVYAFHGINGEDLGFDESLPVDIAVDGTCVPPLEGVTFRQSAGPLDLPPGTYAVDVYLADDTPCGGPFVVSATVGIAFGSTTIIAAHLDQSGAPALSGFTTNAGPLDRHDARLTVYHGAQAGPVDVRVHDHKWIAVAEDLRNGEGSFPVEARSGTYRVRVSPAGSWSELLQFHADLDGAVAAFAVGTPANDTFEVIPVAIDTDQH